MTDKGENGKVTNQEVVNTGESKTPLKKRKGDLI